LAFKNTRHARKGLIPAHCEIPGCTFTAFVTKHRIKPGRKGGKYVPGNVIGLCPNCHILAELGHFSQYELFQLVHARLKLTGVGDGYTEDDGAGQLSEAGSPQN